MKTPTRNGLFWSYHFYHWICLIPSHCEGTREEGESQNPSIFFVSDCFKEHHIIIGDSLWLRFFVFIQIKRLIVTGCLGRSHNPSIPFGPIRNNFVRKTITVFVTGRPILIPYLTGLFLSMACSIPLGRQVFVHGSWIWHASPADSGTGPECHWRMGRQEEMSSAWSSCSPRVNQFAAMLIMISDKQPANNSSEKNPGLHWLAGIVRNVA